MIQKILITGAGGFVGSYLIKELQKSKDIEIFGSVYKSTQDISDLLPKDHIFQGDLTNIEVTKEIIKKVNPNLIYNLAAISVVHNSSDNALPILTQNAAISYNLLECVRQFCPLTRFIAVCSANVYGQVNSSEIPIKETNPLRPLNPYAISKVTQELLSLQYHRSYGLDVVVIRPFNHSGPGQTSDFVLPKLAKQVVSIEREMTLPTLELGSGSVIRDFTDVRDMVKAYIEVAKVAEVGEVYNIGSGHGRTVREIAEIFQSQSKKKFTISEKPELSRSSDVKILVADCSKFHQISHWTPIISLERTISDILEYERNIL